MDADARRRAEVEPHAKNCLCDYERDPRCVFVADAVAWAVTEQNAKIKMLYGACREKEQVGDQLIVKCAQQAEEIARLRAALQVIANEDMTREQGYVVAREALHDD